MLHLQPQVYGYPGEMMTVGAPLRRCGAPVAIFLYYPPMDNDMFR
jgi:hypothetical protein